jgi:hypothetical protein
MRVQTLSVLVLALSMWGGRAGAEPDGLRDTVVAHDLEVGLKVPPSVVYDPARLGHVILPVRVTITNRSARSVALDPKGIKLSARNALATYACDVGVPRERWPEALAPGQSISSERTPVCETTLPGRHDLDVRWAGQGDGEAPIATSAFTILPGVLPPVPLVSRPELVATATGSREVRPSNEAGKVRIILGIVNTSRTLTSLSPLVIDTTLRQRGRTFSCRDRRTVQLAGMLAPGQMHVIWMPLACAVPYEGDWDSTVEVGEPATPMVKLPALVVHVQATPNEMQTPTR